ncbi:MULTISPECIES: 3-keto-5-aminohexanoate cleavage protein [unclassified Lentimicrobium]|uniref:3-keto-5-aminohexanoate cleavage protein n=1 Tax=unclassified Lentimicrobium TaxID=2677434 RepID=UPI001551B9ED|nr:MULTISPECIES: 3-keto-5-aminohexanoate cleavage protein [unclassified Lentimicrobium]NPD45542.1 3-keto-5-aminohexanoate cleavage protein [Lentimicrobium sp. S6]NPD83621.1 3-keto-5-aminohexanoate cleavage protein [Lentimicrobium sp. L6]
MDYLDLIINFTPTGMIPTKQSNRNAPISITEIIEDTHRAYEIGISMVHIHAREYISGEPSFKSEIYAKIIEGIRKISPELIICASLSGRNHKAFEQRAEVLSLDGNLKPDMGSLTLSSLNFSQTESMNSPEMIQNLALEMQKKKILPELEAFDLGMVNYAKYLEQKGLLGNAHYFNIILGNIAGAQSDLLHSGLLINSLPKHSLWSLGGIGNTQLPMNALSIAMGGGVRVGLEDNNWFDCDKKTLATNIDLLSRIHSLAKIHQRKLMTSKKLRELLNLERGFGAYGLQS